MGISRNVRTKTQTPNPIGCSLDMALFSTIPIPISIETNPATESRSTADGCTTRFSANIPKTSAPSPANAKVNLSDVSFLTDNPKRIQEVIDEIAINPTTDTKKSSMVTLLTAFALMAFFFLVVIGIASYKSFRD
jgi:hypothetical protein